MHDEAGGLIDDNDGIILIDHLEFDVFLGLEGERLLHAGRLEELDFVAFGRLRADLLHHDAVHLDGPRLNHLLQTRAGDVRHERSENLVETLAPESLHDEFRQRILVGRSIFKRFHLVVFKILAAIIFAVQIDLFLCHEICYFLQKASDARRRACCGYVCHRLLLLAAKS